MFRTGFSRRTMDMNHTLFATFRLKARRKLSWGSPVHVLGSGELRHIAGTLIGTPHGNKGPKTAPAHGPPSTRELDSGSSRNFPPDKTIDKHYFIPMERTSLQRLSSCLTRYSLSSYFTYIFSLLALSPFISRLVRDASHEIFVTAAVSTTLLLSQWRMQA